MSAHRRITLGVLLGLGGVVVGACTGDPPDAAATAAAETLTLGLPPTLGPLERPAVVFRHDRHTQALPAVGCVDCHPRDAAGRLSRRFARVDEATRRDRLVDLYHARCIGCHAQRPAGQPRGPVTCGECHARRAAASGAAAAGRAPARFDYALHARHARAEKDACERCHHVWDPRARKLVYRKHSEEACATCHGARDDGQRLSLRHAAHRSCIGCHLAKAERREPTGPTKCAGCHGGKVPAGLARPAEVPRLLRGQRDRLAIADPAGRAGAVTFDHRAHERVTSFCNDCHHRSLASCRTCHTITGGPTSGGVTLADAFHRPESRVSCVGCHQARARAERGCAGCHHAPSAAPSTRTCQVCHRGPAPGAAAATAPAPASMPASAPAVVLAPLPPAGAGFPAELTITLRGRAGSKLPHRAITVRLDAAVRSSRLATAFHGSTETLCAGCHHHAPVGQRPAPCRSCHGPAPEATADRPALVPAYHRQCMGCHREMGIKQGCTDCHAKKAEELR